MADVYKVWFLQYNLENMFLNLKIICSIPLNSEKAQICNTDYLSTCVCTVLCETMCTALYNVHSPIPNRVLWQHTFLVQVMLFFYVILFHPIFKLNLSLFTKFPLLICTFSSFDSNNLEYMERSLWLVSYNIRTTF